MTDDELRALDAYWRAANYLSVGQIYLLDNPMLREPLRPEHVKPRLLGHWGTTPGLNFLYTHLNRAIRARDLDAIFVCGPGHGGPAVVAQSYLEGTYTELYPHVTRDEPGLRALFRQFSFPGGIPSHAAPETPGSIHEGGELGYALSHAYGAAFDDPRPDRRLRGRRRRGGDRATRDELALEQVLESGTGRSRPADSPPQRLQDREPDRARADPRRRARLAPARLRARAACLHGRLRRRGLRLDPRPLRRATRPRPRRPPRGDRLPHAQGLDGPARGRRAAGRGHVARAPGAARRGADERRAPPPARGVAAQLPARGALRRATAPSERSSSRSRPRASDGCRRTRRRTAASSCATSSCRTSAVSPCRWTSPARRPPRQPACLGTGSPRSCARTPTTSASSAPTRQPRTGSTPSSR